MRKYAVFKKPALRTPQPVGKKQQVDEALEKYVEMLNLLAQFLTQVAEIDKIADKMLEEASLKGEA